MPGVFLNLLQTTKFKTSFYSVQLAVPLMGETATLHAALPHILRSGSAAYPDPLRMQQQLDTLYGGTVSPTVSTVGEVQCAGFHATFLEDTFAVGDAPVTEQATQLLGELLLHPATRSGRLCAQPVDAARQCLTKELQLQATQDDAYLNQQLLSRMCKGEGYAIGRLGMPNGVRNVTVARMNKYYHEALAKARVELFYVGGTSAPQMADYFREALMGLPRAGTPAALDTLVLRRSEKGARRFGEETSRSHCGLAAGFRTGTVLGDLGYPAFLVCAELYKKRLCSVLSDQTSQSLQCHVTVEPVKGLLTVQLTLPSNMLPMGEEQLTVQLEALQQSGFSTEELTLAQQDQAEQFLGLADQQAALADYWLVQNLADQSMTPEQLAALILNVDKEQVSATAREISLDTVYCLTSAAQQEDG
jgi:predicted Zn-dependent peptidase